MVDVLILTHNEELNLPHALASVQGLAGKVFVLDSDSTDKTAQIASDAGAILVNHPWEGYAAQKNWGLDNLPFESKWILILDADEALTPALREEIRQVISRPPEQIAEAAFYLNRVLIFMGQPIRHCGYFPSWNIRLFKRGTARYEQRDVHEHMIVQGSLAHLRGLMLHEDRRGLEHYIAKHNRYSTLEARELNNRREPWPGLRKFLDDRTARRRFLKYRVATKVMTPWLWRFIYMYVFRAGFLDRQAGLSFCLFISSYELFIRMKYHDLAWRSALPENQGSGLAIAEGELHPLRGKGSAAAVGPLRPLKMSDRDNDRPVLRYGARKRPIMRPENKPFAHKVWRLVHSIIGGSLFGMKSGRSGVNGLGEKSPAGKMFGSDLSKPITPRDSR